jgi:predicted nucleic acid-binding protein
MAWCFTDETTEFTETLLSRLSNQTDRALVPALWLYEVVNVAEVAVRKGRITEEKAGAFRKVSQICPSRSKIPPGRWCLPPSARWPTAIKITGYDAAYLELAIRHNLPLGSLDNALAQAARVAGVDRVQL